MSASLTRVAALASTLPVNPLDTPELGVEPSLSPASAIEARLASPSVSSIVLCRVPPRTHADQPLEVELASSGPASQASAPTGIASCLSTHARLCVSFETTNGQSLSSESAPVSVRPTSSGWVARALIHPATWADAASISVASFSFAGRPLPCDCFPVNLRVGYKHAPAPAGAVLAAAQSGDVEALQAALDAGGSTEEADEYGNTAAAWAAAKFNLEALRTLLEAGANPAAPAEDGLTPLHAAAMSGFASVISLLLATPGSNPLARDDEGKTPLDWAQSEGESAAAALLQADPRVAAALAATATATEV